LTKEYGTNALPLEVSEAIISWSNRVEDGLNYSDFETVSQYMNNEMYDLIVGGGISEKYLNDLINFAQKERGNV